MSEKAHLRSTDVRDIYHTEYFLERVDGYDEFASFDGSPKSLFSRARRNFELLSVRPGERLLDLGCGRGEIAIAAGVAGAVAVGCDFSQGAIRLARGKAREIEARLGRSIHTSFICAIATEGTFAPNSFDHIYMAEFVEHVAPQELAVILRSAHRWLRQGGRIFIYTHPNRWARRTYPLMRAYTRAATGVDTGAIPPDMTHPDYKKLHLNEQSYLSLRRALGRAGFRDVRVRFDRPDTPGRCAPLKRLFLYQVLFGYDIVGQGTKRA